MQSHFRKSAIGLALLLTVALASSAVQAQTSSPMPDSSKGSQAPDSMSKSPTKTDPKSMTSEAPPTSTPPASTTSKPTKINVNSASADDLVKAGLDATTAKLIVQGQPYKSTDQILELKGLTPESKDVLTRNLGLFTTSSEQ
jgi:DNA uptake protein ComE-like DNA-binding protein